MSETIVFGGKEIEAPKQRKGQDPFHYQKLAIRYMQESGEIFRFYNGRLLRYTGTHYVEDVDLDTRLRTFFIAHNVAHNNNVIGNVTPFIRALSFVDPVDHKELPFFIGENRADPRKVIPFRNGLLDMDRAIAGHHDLIPHSPKWVSTNCLPYDYDPDAVCPRWLAFLDQTFDGDVDRVALLQEFAGYLLLPDPSRQKMLAMVGVSRGGKGTIATILQEMLGHGNWTAFSLAKLANSFGLTNLVDRLAAFVGEVNLQQNRDRYSILESLNCITGRDPVNIEWKFSNTKLSTVLPTRFVIACNAFPNWADPSGALAERTLVLNFNRAIPEDKRDPCLADKLKTEIAGICNWAIAGLIRLNRNNRWTIPELSKESLNKIRRTSSAVVAYAQDRLIVSTKLDTGNLHGIELSDRTDLKVTRPALIADFEEWARDYDGEVNATYLGRDLETVLPGLKPVKACVDGLRHLRRWEYRGIEFKPD